MYISRIRLHNIRGFKNFDLSITNFEGHPRMNTTIIGKNGTNKTTLLRCIVIGLCDSPQANALLAEDIGRVISEDSNSATITIELSSKRGKHAIRKVQTRLKWDADKDIVVRQVRNPKNFDSSSILVCGYGVARSNEGPAGSGRGYQLPDSNYTLFNYEAYLIDSEVSYRRLREYLGAKLFRKTLKGIKVVLGLTNKDSIKLEKGGGLYFAGPSLGKAVYYAGWADGYSMTFNWILDFYLWALQTRKLTSDGKIEGILLIDEPEQHTHPSMQMGILRNLSVLLPDVQIFSATHSSLIALGMEREELVVLKRRGKIVKEVKNIPDYSHFSAEDMLTDERLFEAEAFRPEHLEMVRLREDLKKIPKSKRTPKQKKNLLNVSTLLVEKNRPSVKESRILADIEKLRHKYSL